jgi:SAM-dependent methyltransferase
VTDDFNRALQNKMRGTRAAVKARLFVYLPFVYPLLHAYPSAPALDVSCGQGEWLETLQESGFTVQGVDSDAAQIAVCQKRGFAAQTSSALTALQAAPAQSYALVSALGLAEQLPLETLKQVVQEAHRVLMPGGLLLLQAAHQDNMLTDSHEAVLDATRAQYISPTVIAFLPEYFGFETIKTVRLHEQLGVAAHQPVGLVNVLKDASPSYAVIAQKAMSGMSPPVVIKAFEQEYGLSLETLAVLFDQQLDARIRVVAESAARAEAALAAIHTSFLWKLTSPIRWAEQQVEQLKAEGVGARLSAFVEKVQRIGVRRSLPWLEVRPRWRRLHGYVVALNHRLIARQAAAAEQKKIPLDPAIIQQAYQTRERIETLSPEAQEIYRRLQQISSEQQDRGPALQQDITRGVSTNAAVQPIDAAAQSNSSSSPHSPST